MTRTEKIKTEFVRNGNSRQSRPVETIHRASCGRVKQMTKPLPWNWAEENGPADWVYLSWFRPCPECCADLYEQFPALESRVR